MISLLEALVFSVVQGISQWLPISSSGHVAILENIFGFQSLPFVVFLQLASILAVIVLFWKDIVKVLDLRKKENVKYILMIIVAVIPVAVIGYLFEKEIAAFFSSLFYLGIFFILSGLIIYSTKFAKPKKESLNWLDSVFVGLMQAISIVPGISRSGATISGGMFRGVSKSEAVKFSFLLAVPTILGASVLELKNLSVIGVSTTILIVTFVLTFLVSIVAIKALLKVVKSNKFYLFGIYDILVGIIVLGYSLVVH